MGTYCSGGSTRSLVCTKGLKFTGLFSHAFANSSFHLLASYWTDVDGPG